MKTHSLTRLSSRVVFLTALFLAASMPQSAIAGEADLIIPSLDRPIALGLSGQMMLMGGVAISVMGLAFGIWIFAHLKSLPVHTSMLEVSDLIYETCKTYLKTQGKFILLLWVFIATVVAVYFGKLAEYHVPGDPPDAVTHGFPLSLVGIILFFSLVGIAGSYLVAWFGIRVNTFANSRTAFASLAGKPYPCYAIPLQAGMSIGMMLISVELLIMLCILLFVPGNFAGPCFIGFAIGESLGAAALRIAGGIFTKIADIGSDLMKIVFGIKEDDARNPGVIADCTGDNAGDSVGPSADGFETYGVTGVALITFILLAINPESVKVLAGEAVDFHEGLQVQLLVWIFVMRVMMVVASAVSYFVNETITRSKSLHADKMEFESPLTRLVWITSIVSIVTTYAISWVTIGPNAATGPLAGDSSLWWILSSIISCGTLAGALIPELVKIFTSTHSSHVKEVVQSSKAGGASLNILSGLVAGNFSCYWLGLSIVGLMTVAHVFSIQGLENFMQAPSVFAFGLVAFGFLGMGPVTIAVDSYGPVTDNAQSVFELSLIENIPNISQEIKQEFGFTPVFDRAKRLLEENDGAGNTFKATAKPVLIGTAVVGATTMIFSIIMNLTEQLTADLDKLSLLHAPFMLGLVTGGAIIYWFTGASIQAVTTGAYRAVEFIKANIKLDGATKASVEDSKKVVEICTIYAQKGMFNIFLGIFFITLAFAFADPFFFIGYLISIAISGLYQAIFMANAGGAWDNAKKLVEVDMQEKGTELHAATVVGDTVGDPFKDTSSVALNPVIKFTTLFGLLAVELAVSISKDQSSIDFYASTGVALNLVIAAVLFVVASWFVHRSFYGMRIGSQA